MKLVKQQINGDERMVLKAPASVDDLRAEAARLEQKFGYHAEARQGGKYLLTHPCFRGEFMLWLEPEA